MKSLAPIHIRALLRLADRYGHDAFVQAAGLAQDYRRYDSHAVQRILENKHGEGNVPVVLPLKGAGPAMLGEVEPGDLDTYGYLDSHTKDGCGDEHDDEE